MVLSEGFTPTRALWLRVAVLDPDPDWLQWYRLVTRLIGYARLDASHNSCDTVCSWATCPAASCAGAHVFRDDTGEFSLAELTRVIDRLATSKPLLATRLSRTIIQIAEIDQKRDRIARALLDWEELPVSDD